MVLYFFSLFYDCFKDVSVLFTLAKRWFQFIDEKCDVLGVDPSRSFRVILAPLINQRLEMLTSDRTVLLSSGDSKTIQDEGCE
jgi:hypothetical protein